MSYLVIALLSLAPAACGSAALTQVIVVRHAEKAPDGGADPELSPRGRERARALATLLAEARVDTVYATELQRTQATVAPTAARAKLTPIIVPAREPEALARRIREAHRGRVVLVAGHSNTVPAVIRSLGGPAIADLAEDAYDDIFVVTFSSDRSTPARVLHLRYPAF